MQPVPEGYEPLEFVGFTDRGFWSDTETYIKNDIVHRNNTAWRCLTDNTTGVIPEEGENWTIFIASESDSSGITTTDTQGIVGENGEKVSNQALIDAIADRVINTLMAKSMMSGIQVNDENKVPTSALAYAMQQSIDSLNANIANLLSDATITTIPVTPNTAYNTGFTVKQIGKLVVINFQTDWAQWDNGAGILIGWIKKQPIAYVSREVVFANGVGQVFGVGNIYITNTQILVQTPTDWVNGAYAHISGTIAFYV